MSNWISVKDRLPEDGQEVDVWQSGNFNRRFTNVYYVDDGFFAFKDGTVYMRDVSHWMPVSRPEDK